MEDLFRFIWRGALGGAIVPVLFYVYLMSFSYGTIYFWYFLLGILFTTIPGGIVGLILWVLCVRFVDRLGSLSRIMLGIAIVLTIVVLELIYFAYSQPHDSPNPTGLNSELPRMLFGLFYVASIGALAGWLCPPAAVLRREPELTYWERVQQYEAAEAEREFRLAQLDSEKSRETDPST